ncbi:MAG: hypothetical protein AB7P21_06495 [Lautropia sp.]
MNPLRIDAPLRALIPVALLTLLAACAAPGSERDQSPRTADSPQRFAGDAPIAWALDGNLEMVLTDRRDGAFAQARAHPVDMRRDGEPLVLRLRTRSSLGDIALPASSDARYAFSAWPHLRLEVGRPGSRSSRHTCYLTLTPADMMAFELAVPLAPASIRPGSNPADCWLAAAIDASQRRDASDARLELRLLGHIGRRDAWLPRPDLLASVQLRIGADAGAPRYAAMLEALDRRLARPDASQDPPPGIDGATLFSTAPDTADRVDAQGTPATDPPVGAIEPVSAGANEAPRPTMRPPLRPSLRPSPPPPMPTSLPTSQPASTLNVPVGATAAGIETTRFVFHHAAGDDAAAARSQALAERLAATSDAAVEVRAVPVPVSTDNIRVFFGRDRAPARAARRSLDMADAAIRDFSDYRPLPRPGTIELWIAAAPPAAGASIDQPSSDEVLSRR